MERNDYNGWTNYETWLTALWIDNDEYLMEEMRNASAEQIKDWYHDQIDALFPHGDNLFSDILNAHSREVNWEEIAEHMLDEVEEE